MVGDEATKGRDQKASRRGRREIRAIGKGSRLRPSCMGFGRGRVCWGVRDRSGRIAGVDERVYVLRGEVRCSFAGRD